MQKYTSYSFLILTPAQPTVGQEIQPPPCPSIGAQNRGSLHSYPQQKQCLPPSLDVCSLKEAMGPSIPQSSQW